MAGDSYKVGDVGRDSIIQQGTGHHLTINKYAAPAPRPVTWPIWVGVVPPEADCYQLRTVTGKLRRHRRAQRVARRARSAGAAVSPLVTTARRTAVGFATCASDSTTQEAFLRR